MGSPTASRKTPAGSIVLSALIVETYWCNISLVDAPAVSKRYRSAEINDSTSFECCPVYSRHNFKSSIAGELQKLVERKKINYQKTWHEQTSHDPAKNELVKTSQMAQVRNVGAWKLFKTKASMELQEERVDNLNSRFISETETTSFLKENVKS